MPVTNPKGLVVTLCAAIQKYQRNTDQEMAQLDVSGGVDSAVMLCLLSEALGPNKIIAVYSDINSSQESGTRAKEVAKVANVDLIYHKLTDTYQNLVTNAKVNLRFRDVDMCLKGAKETDALEKRIYEDPTIEGSIRSILRATLGRAYNRLAGGGIRYGTGNECEDRFLRFYQKGGDGEVDCNPLANLSKGEIFQLAYELDVPTSILNAIPSPDLWGGSEHDSDEAELLKLTGVSWTYSNVVDGKYVYNGTIERVSRFCDKTENALFDDDIAIHEILSDNDTYIPRALLDSAKLMEYQTRHKYNPNCPSIVSRGELLEEGLITNKLS